MRRSAPDGSRWFRDGRRRQRAPAGARRFCAPCTGCVLLGGFSSLPGENAENTCQRGATSVDASLRCGKSTDALWQGSSVGQSMRFIPAVSGVQIPPLLPEDSSGSGLSRAAFLLWPESAERLGAQWTPTARRFLILRPPRTSGVALWCGQGALQACRMIPDWTGSRAGRSAPARRMDIMAEAGGIRGISVQPPRKRGIP